MKTIFEAAASTSRAYNNILRLIEEDDGLDLDRSERLKRAEKRLDLRMEIMQEVLESKDM